MINIISSKKQQVNSIRKELSNRGIEFLISSWISKIGETDCILVLSLPENTPLEKAVNPFLRRNIPVIILFEDSKYDKLKDDKLLHLPDNFPVEDIPSLLSWVLILKNEFSSMSEKNSTMTSFQDTLEKKRSIELESANDVLLKQASKLQNAMEKLEVHNRQILEELSLASELQKSLLPKEFPDDLPFNIAHRYVPFLDIGGDFFDVIRLDKTTVGFIITDVSGHGVASAFLTSMFKSSFNHFAPEEFSPAVVLSNLNKEFSRTIRTEHYLTAFYLIINTETMKCTFCNAGHPKQLLFRESGEIVELTTIGFFIGMFEGTDYEDNTIDLISGDKICLFTDGIMETVDPEGNLFGRENIIRVIQEGECKSLNEISNNLFSKVIEHMGDAGQDDDITFLLIELMENL